MEQYVGLDVSLKETSLCVYQTGTTLAVADTILWPPAEAALWKSSGARAPRENRK